MVVPIILGVRNGFAAHYCRVWSQGRIYGTILGAIPSSASWPE